MFPNFFWKGRQIKIFKSLYIYIKKKFRSGQSCNHPDLKVAPPLSFNPAIYFNGYGVQNFVELGEKRKKKKSC